VSSASTSCAYGDDRLQLLPDANGRRASNATVAHGEERLRLPVRSTSPGRDALLCELGWRGARHTVPDVAGETVAASFETYPAPVE
jgi:hypothetical protein